MTRPAAVAGVALFLLASPAAAGWLFDDAIAPAKPPVESSGEPAEVSPLVSSIMLPLSVPLSVLAEGLNRVAPASQDGWRGDPLGNPVVDDVLTWHFERGPITVSGGNNRISVAASIAGLVRIRGNVRLIRGAVGKLLGKLNPTNVPFSAHADLKADVSASASPVLQSTWRLAPNFALAINVTQAEIPVNHVGTVSVRGHVRDGIEAKRAALEAELNARVANDPFLETAARAEWARLCQAVDIGKPGLPAWLVLEPRAVSASGPVITERDLALSIGLEATARITTGSAPPAPVCPEFPATLELRETATGAFRLALPVLFGWQEINDQLAMQLANKTFQTKDQAASLTVISAALEPSGDRLLLTAAIKASASGLFGSEAAGTIYVWAKPELDVKAQVIRLTDVEVDASSPSPSSSLVLDSLAAGVVSLAAPFIAATIAENAELRLAPLADSAKQKALEAAAALNGEPKTGAKLAVSVDQLELTSLAVTAQGLALTGLATGRIAAEITAIRDF